MKIRSFARTAEEFEGIHGTFVGKDDTSVEQCVIESVRKRGNAIFVKLKGVNDSNAAAAYRSSYIFVEEQYRIQLPKEKFFIDDLIGCAVVSEDGKKFGTIISVDALPVQMVYTVKTLNGEVLLPAVPEFILSVNVEKKEIIVRPPEGLFEGDML